ncbi:MAG: RNA-binding protein [Arthrobacter sp.]|nr:RNA-binding protein [Arthrobacter sp.]
MTQSPEQDHASDAVEDVAAAPEQQQPEQGNAEQETATIPASRLDEEGDAAADYLEELLDIADLDGDIDIEVKAGRVYVSLQSEDEPGSLDQLVGQDGSTLEALQELARLAVLASTGQRSRFILDVDGYRARRGAELGDLAAAVIESVKASGEPEHLRAMSAYERKLVHDLVAEAGLVSDSEGEGPRRHVVVHPAEG